MKYNNILVTGGSGLLGKHLQEIMPDAIYLSSKECDLRKEEEVKKLFEAIKPDCVIHLASIVGGIQFNIENPVKLLDDNILINTLVLKYSKNSNVKKLIGISSTCAYPEKVNSYPMTEEDIHSGPPTNTNFSYAMSKRVMMTQIDSYNKQYNTNYNYLIPSNLYGEHDEFNETSSHFVTALIKKIHEAKKELKNEITLMGTGLPLRQFMYAKDLAHIIKFFIDNNISENVNVAYKENSSIEQIAKIALKSCESEHLKLKFDISKSDGQYRKDVSIDRLLSLIPNFKFTSLEKGIKETYEKAIEFKKLK